MRNGTAAEDIDFKCIPLKSPFMYPMHHSAFGLLKRTLFKRHAQTLDGLGKIAKEEWNKIDLDVLNKSTFILEINIKYGN